MSDIIEARKQIDAWKMERCKEFRKLPFETRKALVTYGLYAFGIDIEAEVCGTITNYWRDTEMDLPSEVNEELVGSIGEFFGLPVMITKRKEETE